MNIFDDNKIIENVDIKLATDFIEEHCWFQCLPEEQYPNYKDYDLQIIDGFVYLFTRGSIFVDTSNIPPFIKISAQSTISVTVCGPVVNLDFLDPGYIDALQLIGSKNNYPYNCNIISYNSLYINTLLDGFNDGVSLDINDYSIIENLKCFYSKITKFDTKNIKNISLDNISAQCMIEYLLNKKFHDIDKFNVNVIK